jgi:uncharacterized protein (TIGR02145 family)
MKIYTFLFLIFCLSSCKKENNNNTNSCNVESLVDIDGNVYEVVSIGNQCWMKENLRVTKFKNGDPISMITGNSNWVNTQQPAYCYYNNDLQNEIKYGKLYNGMAVNDTRGIAPEGWRVPTENDWNELFNFLGGYTIAGKAMKVSGAGNFGSSNTGTNSSGFTALPGGHRVGNSGASNGGTFACGGSWARFWGTNSYSFYITDYQDMAYGGASSMTNGIAIRLIKE